MKSVVKRFVFESQKDDGSPMEGNLMYLLFEFYGALLKLRLQIALTHALYNETWVHLL